MDVPLGRAVLFWVRAAAHHLVVGQPVLSRMGSKDDDVPKSDRHLGVGMLRFSRKPPVSGLVR